MSNQGMPVWSCRLPPEIIAALRQYAAAEGVSVSDVARVAIESFLDPTPDVATASWPAPHTPAHQPSPDEELAKWLAEYRARQQRNVKGR